MIKSAFIQNQGFLVTKDDIGILSHAFAASKPEHKDNIDPATLYGILRDFIEKYKNSSALTSGNELTGAPFVQGDFKPYDEVYGYKTISKTFLPSITKGIFRLGTITDYRRTEGKIWQDPAEGRVLISVATRSRDIFHLITSGLHHYVFCTSSTPSLAKFGGVTVKVNLKQFADAVAKSIHALDYSIQKVQYRDAKVFSTALDKEIKLPDNGEELGTEYWEDVFTILRENLFYPSLFVKPVFFSDEGEIRIAFRMRKDVRKPLLINDQAAFKACKVL